MSLNLGISGLNLHNLCEAKNNLHRHHTRFSGYPLIAYVCQWFRELCSHLDEGLTEDPCGGKNVAYDANYPNWCLLQRRNLRRVSFM